MTVTQKKAVIMFADISGSTSLYDKLGNKLALQLVATTLDILKQEMTAHLGVLIKTIGDEIMCTFAEANSAISAACAMQRAVEKHCPGGGDLPISIRIGMHYGEVIFEGGDAYGDTVNIAAHVTAITRARQILTTQALVDELPKHMRLQVHQVMRTEFRGKGEATDVYQVTWEQGDTTNTRIGMRAFRKPTGTRNELVLRYHQQVITLSETKKSIVLGRGSDCDMVIRDKLASRQHASIEYNFGKFLITDFSVNGTYIRFSDNQVIQLSRQQIVLHGAGMVSLGKAFSEEPTEIIDFILQ